MDIVSANDGDICPRCKKTLHSLESVLELSVVTDNHLRSLSGSWFYHDRPASIYSSNSSAVESDSVFEHAAKYLVSSASVCLFCSLLLSGLSPTWNKLWTHQGRLSSLSQEGIKQVVRELGDEPIYLSRSFLGKDWNRGLSVRRAGNFENTITLYIDHGKPPQIVLRPERLRNFKIQIYYALALAKD
jgi:hypothetical protein